jgi:hypothetical protein
MIDDVLKLFSRGLLCVPLSKGGRHLDLQTIGYNPLHLITRQKYLKELCFNSVLFELSQNPPTKETLYRWFDGFSGNVGIVGGFMNLMVLDFDDPAVYHRWSRKNPMLANTTPVAKSPRGFHVYLRTSVPTLSTSLHMGFRRAGHVKALGSYVLCPPSRLKSGLAYHWLAGQSPFETEPQQVEDLKNLAMSPYSPFKVLHDRLRKRGQFDPD